MPLKIIGIIIIIFSASFIGYGKAWNLEERLRDIRNLKQCLQILEREITYLANSIPQALFNASKVNSRVSALFLNCSRILQGKQGFCIADAIKLSISQNIDKTFLSPEDILILTNLGASLGSYDIQSQTSSIKLAESQLLLQEKYAEEQLNKNGKMYKKLGMLCGIAISIVLI